MGATESSPEFKDGVDRFVDAAARGDWETIEEIFTQGAMYLNAKDSKGRTALIAALLNRHRSVAIKLLDISGIAYDCKDRNGVTPLMLVSGHGDLELVDRLLAAKAKVNIFDEEDRWGPLHFAVAHGHVDVVRRLHEAGATLYRRDRYGQTLLHLAAHEGHITVAEYLIERGMSLEDTDHESKTPYDLAEGEEMRELLRHAEARAAAEGKDELDVA